MVSKGVPRLAASALLALGVACTGDTNDTGDSAPIPVCDLPLTYEKSPEAELSGSGWHRIYVDGVSGTPDEQGRYQMREHRNLIALGDHFLLSAGALVEWTYPVADTLTGRAHLHVARVDEPDLVARYELLLVRATGTLPILSVDDGDDGEQGYVPYEDCFHAPAAAVPVEDSDHLLLRMTNLTGGELGIVVAPPDYFTWVDVEVE